MDLSVISNGSFPGKVLRLPLKLVPAQARMPILQGRLRGKWWIAGSFNHSCWVGNYEHEKRQAFEKLITPGMVVWDVGAHVGFYSLLASQLVAPGGKVFAIEPLPRNLKYLYAHLRMNHASNVAVVEAGAWDTTGAMAFSVAKNSAMGHLTSLGTLQVRTVALDDIVGSGQIALPDAIKMDIEGAEYHALEGARKALAAAHPIIFLATHGDDVHRQCCTFLRTLGYRLVPVSGSSIQSTDEILGVFDGHS